MYEGLIKDDVHKLTIEHTPHLNITLNDTHVLVKTENVDFDACKDMKYELQCRAPNSDIYTSVENFTQSTLDVEDYQGMICRVRYDKKGN